MKIIYIKWQKNNFFFYVYVYVNVTFIQIICFKKKSKFDISMTLLDF